MILIVEDYYEVAVALRSLFRMEGYAARIADCGTAAIDLLRQQPATVVLLDYMLPDMNGVEVAESLLAEGLAAPEQLVFYTAVPHHVTAKARAIGAAVIQKGTPWETVLGRVTETVRRVQSRPLSGAAHRQPPPADGAGPSMNL